MIPSQQRRTVQRGRNWRNGVIDRGQNRRKHVRSRTRERSRNSLLSSLEHETSKIVALQKICTRIHTTSEVTKIHWGVGVYGAEIATKQEKLRVLGGRDCEIAL